MSQEVALIILAAGKGTRLRHPDSKVLASTGFDSLLGHVLELAKQADLSNISVVVGHGREKVEAFAKEKAQALDLPPLNFAHQEVLDGTGSAVRAALPSLKGFNGNVLILSGDVPLLSKVTLNDLFEAHEREKATVSILSAELREPAQYGRVLRGTKGEFTAIREWKDCEPSQRSIREVNAGIYFVDSAFLFPAIDELTNDNAQSEYYLTDIIERASKEGQHVIAHVVADESEILGVNRPSELALVREKLRRRRNLQLIDDGIYIEDPESAFIAPSVTFSGSASIGPNVILCGTSNVGDGVVVEGSSRIESCSIGAGSRIRFGCSLLEATIGENCAVGPFAHLRPETQLGNEVRVGNFVEVKKSTLGEGAKANHLTYIGDASVGSGSNIGAGTITCNYDGYKKSQTNIGKNAFIGSNSVLVAPVSVGDGAFVGAATTVTKDVSSDALAVSRADQKEIPGWATKKRQKAEKK